MRSFYFVAKNIGAHERYLTYVLGEGMDIDEDVLDYCEENFPPEILKIIYEEDDDFDYLSYDVSDLITLEKFTEGNMNKETVLKILRNVAIGMINIKEYAIPMSYVLLNKSFMYIDPDNLDITFLYLPVEGDASVSAEFKSFVRQFIAHMKFNIDEDVSFVGQLLTYINGDGFNLRGLIGLSEALMQDAGIGYMSEVGISAEDGTEVVGSADLDAGAEEPEKNVSDFMKDLGESDGTPLPEIGDDEEDEALEDVTEAAAAAEIPTEKKPAPEPEPEPIPESVPEPVKEEKDIELSDAAPVEEPAPAPAPVQEEEHEETLDELKERLEGILEGKKPPKKQPPKKPEPPKKPAVRVSRAAMLKEKAEEIAEEDAEHAAEEAEAAASAAPEAPVEEKSDKKSKKEKEAEAPAPVAEVAAAAEAGTERANAQPTEVVNNTIIGTQGAAIKINPYLIRNDNHERIMITKAVFKIGKASRGVDYHIGGNSAISRQHCVILHKGDSYYLKDNKSTNHTYLDGRQLEPDEEALLKNKAVITLGDEDFTFMEG